MTWLNRQYFCNLYSGFLLVGQVSRWNSAGQGWRGFLLDNGQVTERIGWFATVEEARSHVEAKALSGENAIRRARSRFA
jgi:hypothetical protein